MIKYSSESREFAACAPSSIHIEDKWEFHSIEAKCEPFAIR